MIAAGLACKKRVCALLVVPDVGLVIAGSVVRRRHRLLVALFASTDPAVPPSCSWEDDDDPSFNPEDLYDDSYGSLDDLEKLSGFDEAEEYVEEEDDDYEDYEEDYEEDVDS